MTRSTVKANTADSDQPKKHAENPDIGRIRDSITPVSNELNAAAWSLAWVREKHPWQIPDGEIPRPAVVAKTINHRNNHPFQYQWNCLALERHLRDSQGSRYQHGGAVCASSLRALAGAFRSQEIPQSAINSAIGFAATLTFFIAAAILGNPIRTSGGVILFVAAISMVFFATRSLFQDGRYNSGATKKILLYTAAFLLLWELLILLLVTI